MKKSMMTKDQIYKISVGSINLLLASLLAVALVLPGTGLIKQSLPVASDQSEVESVDMPISPATTEQAKKKESGSMLPDGRPVTADLSWLVQALSGQISHLQSKRFSKKTKTDKAACFDLQVAGKSAIVASTSFVSSSLGRQFTLLGGKPSGTS